jgi:hypothetical protein
VEDRWVTREFVRAAKARGIVASFGLPFAAGALACADEHKSIACFALSGARIDAIEQHTGSLPAISPTDDQALRGNAVDHRAAQGWSKLR